MFHVEQRYFRSSIFLALRSSWGYMFHVKRHLSFANPPSSLLTIRLRPVRPSVETSGIALDDDTYRAAYTQHARNAQPVHRRYVCLGETSSLQKTSPPNIQPDQGGSSQPILLSPIGEGLGGRQRRRHVSRGTSSSVNEKLCVYGNGFATFHVKHTTTNLASMASSGGVALFPHGSSRKALTFFINPTTAPFSEKGKN